MKFNPLAALFQIISNTINGAEKSILDLLSALVPWAVPVIPAYMTFYHTMNQMGFPAWVAGTAAFVVEALGLASVSTAIRFYRNNQRYKEEKNKAPFRLAIVIYVFYIVVVLVVNVILEWVAGTRTGFVILAIALFSMLSIPSGVLISIRTQYSEMLEERSARYAKTETKQDEQTDARARSRKPASGYRDQILAMLEQEYSANKRVLSPKEITSRLKLDHDKSKGYVSTLTSQWKAKGGGNGFTF